MSSKVRLLGAFLAESFRLAVRKQRWLARLGESHGHYRGGEAGNDAIRMLLAGSRPFFVGRLGFTESAVAGAVLAMQDLDIGRALLDRVKYKMYEHDAFWPRDDELLVQFGRLVLGAVPDFDVQICWNTFLERHLVRVHARPDTVRADFYALEPFCFARPWSGALAGRSVLVICPYPETVRRQYAKRDRLWRDPSVLPPFRLHVQKAVYGRASAPGCATWFDALDAMYADAMRTDFDVALLACGPFAIPLGSRFKRAGRSAITMCGVTQILFGIRGRRWDERPYVAKFYNGDWTRPDPAEMPEFARNVEGGCYL